MKPAVKTKVLLIALFLMALVLRLYRLDQLLGFYYDQGRDAKVIWDLWHQGDFFLIGPTTGIEGIFRGPWYYWLIAPWYLIFNGHPLAPATFLVVMSVVAIGWLYRLATEVGDKRAGWLALILATFSTSLVGDARWLSNPTPMLFISMAVVQSIVWILKDKHYGWLLAGASLGMAMQFGSAAEIFYFPVFIALAVYKRHHLPLKWILGGVSALVVAFLPQIIFDVRNDGVLTHAIKNFLITERSFGLTFWQTVSVRFPFYAHTFIEKVYPSSNIWWWVLGFSLIASLLIYWRKLNTASKYILGLFFSPLVGMLFFQGNEGNVYGYYFTGYFMIFILVVAVLLSRLVVSKLGKFLLVLLMTVFIAQNTTALRSRLGVEADKADYVTFATQLQAIDWVYAHSNNQPFNVDVYVPPVIPHAYDYLFLWLGTTKYNQLPSNDLQPTLFMLYEADPPHPQRLEVWLKRQREIGNIQQREVFGNITVDKTNRVKWE